MSSYTQRPADSNSRITFAQSTIDSPAGSVIGVAGSIILDCLSEASENPSPVILGVLQGVPHDRWRDWLGIHRP